MLGNGYKGHVFTILDIVVFSFNFDDEASLMFVDQIDMWFLVNLVIYF